MNTRPVSRANILRAVPLPGLLQLADFGPTAKILVGDISIDVLLGLRPKGKAQRFIENGIAKRGLPLREAAGFRTNLWNAINSRGFVTDTGCHIKDFLYFISTRAGLSLRFPTKEEAEAIAKKKRGQLLKNGIGVFETCFRRRTADVNGGEQYPQYCLVKEGKLDFYSRLPRQVVGNPGIILVQID